MGTDGINANSHSVPAKINKGNMTPQQADESPFIFEFVEGNVQPGDMKVKKTKDGAQISFPYDGVTQNKRAISEAKIKKAGEMLAKQNYKSLSDVPIDDIEVYNDEELSKQKAQLYVKRAERYYEMGDYKKVFDDYDNAIVLDRKNPNLYKNKALIHLSKGGGVDNSHARVDLSRAIDLSPEDGILYSLRGDANLDKGTPQAEKAKEDYSAAIRLNPEMFLNYSKRAEAEVRLGQTDSALEDLKKSRELIMNVFPEPEKTVPLAEVNNRIKVLEEIEKTGFDFTRISDQEVSHVANAAVADAFVSTLAKYSHLIEHSKCLKLKTEYDDNMYVKLYPISTDKDGKRYLSDSSQRFTVSMNELDSPYYVLKDKDNRPVKVYFDPSQDLTLKALEIGLMKSMGNSYEECCKVSASDTIRLLYGPNGSSDAKRIVSSISNKNATTEDFKNGIDIVFKKGFEVGGKQILDGSRYIINGYNETNGLVSLSDTGCDNRESTNDNIVVPLKDLLGHDFRLSSLKRK